LSRRPNPSPRPGRGHSAPSLFAELLDAPDINIASRMVSYSFDRYGHFIATLANGQVWREVEGDSSTAHWHKPASGYLVNITGGALGSYNFAIKGNPVKYKVRRVS